MAPSPAVGMAATAGRPATGWPGPTARSRPRRRRSTTDRWPAALNAPVAHIVATPDGGGYWLVAADGGIFSLRRRRLLRLDGRPAPQRPGGGHRPDPRRPRLLAGGHRRRRLRLRRRRVLRLDGRPASQRARWSASPRPGRPAATGWSPSDGGIFAFDDAVPGFDRQPASQPAGQRHGGHRRTATATGSWPSTAASSPTATPRFHGSAGGPPLNAPDRGHGRRPGDRWLLAGRCRRRRLRLSARRSSVRLNARHRGSGADAERRSPSSTQMMDCISE